MPVNRFYIFLFLIISFGPFAWGQTVSPNSSFQVDYVRGCAPLTITVNNLNATEADSYWYDADTCIVSSPKYNATICGSMARSSNTTFTYTQPGTYTLVNQFLIALPRNDTLTIEVFDPLPPEFNVSLCRSNAVQVNITDTYYEQYEIDYGDGSPLTSNTNHTYAANGTYSITVRGQFLNSPNNCGSTTEMISTVNTLTPAVINQIEVLQVDNGLGSIQLDYTLTPGVSYTLEVSENGIVSFVGLGGISSNSLLIENLDTQNNYYCYRIIANDVCNNETNASNTVCSTQLTGTAMANQNDLSWVTENIGFLNYEIFRETTFLGPLITNYSNQSYTDTTATCDQNTCYQVVTNYQNGSRSISAERCLQSISTQAPPTITNLTASIEGNQVQLSWDLPDATNFPLSRYTITRSTNGGEYQTVARDSIMPYLDNASISSNQYCYRIVYEDPCGNISAPSEPACPILLQGQNMNNTTFNLDWTFYLGWQTGVREYILETTDMDGNALSTPISFSDITNDFQDVIDLTRQIVRYRIQAISNDPTPLVSFSNYVILDIPAQVFLPNAFTPNSDGLNDTFQAKGIFIDQFNLKIFSQWGELLFISGQLDVGWPGTFNGELMPGGTYAYLVEIVDPLGRSEVKRGTVHLLK